MAIAAISLKGFNSVASNLEAIATTYRFEAAIISANIDTTTTFGLLLQAPTTNATTFTTVKIATKMVCSRDLQDSLIEGQYDWLEDQSK